MKFLILVACCCHIGGLSFLDLIVTGGLSCSSFSRSRFLSPLTLELDTSFIETRNLYSSSLNPHTLRRTLACCINTSVHWKSFQFCLEEMFLFVCYLMKILLVLYYYYMVQHELLKHKWTFYNALWHKQSAFS